MRDITAVLGLYRGLERTKIFLEDFKKRFPDIPLSLGCVGNTQEYQDEMKRLYGDAVVTGRTDRVAFSETWNSAILGVKTSKFVFLHNDMYLADDFFDTLEDKYLKDPKKFYVYTTVEPLSFQGFPRPGKIIADFGTDVDDFNLERFNRFVKQYQKNHQVEGRGYGFYLAGFTESLKDVGGFDYQSFFPIFCEDDDLLVRIRTKGYLLCTAPAAILYHFGSKTTREPGFSGMSNGEINSNRMFARKWGFEARYLWTTGYELSNEPTEIGVERIGYRIADGVEVSLADIINVEPLVDAIQCTDPTYIKYLEEINHPEKSVRSVDDFDIVLTQTGPVNFNDFAYLVGDLRFKRNQLKPGTYKKGNYVITVNRILRNQSNQDPKNYLLLQSQQ